MEEQSQDSGSKCAIPCIQDDAHDGNVKDIAKNLSKDIDGKPNGSNQEAVPNESHSDPSEMKSVEMDGKSENGAKCDGTESKPSVTVDKHGIDNSENSTCAKNNDTQPTESSDVVDSAKPISSVHKIIAALENKPSVREESSTDSDDEDSDFSSLKRQRQVKKRKFRNGGKTSVDYEEVHLRKSQDALDKTDDPVIYANINKQRLKSDISGRLHVVGVEYSNTDEYAKQVLPSNTNNPGTAPLDRTEQHVLDQVKESAYDNVVILEDQEKGIEGHMTGSEGHVTGTGSSRGSSTSTDPYEDIPEVWENDLYEATTPAEEAEMLKNKTNSMQRGSPFKASIKRMGSKVKKSLKRSDAVSDDHTERTPSMSAGNVACFLL